LIYFLVALTGLFSLPPSVLCADIDEQIAFDIPQAQAGDALNLYAQQAGVQLMYPYKNLKEIVSNRVKGILTKKDALDRLLSGTGYAAEFSADGTITIQTHDDNNDEGRTMKTRNKFLAALLSIFSATQVMGAVDAVEPDSVSEQATTIEEVIVTAQKREQNIQDVPISIAAFSAADLEARSFTSLRDLGQFTPNFSFSDHSFWGSQAGMVFIRGVGQTDPSAFNDPGVGIYMDGVYMGRMQGIDFDLMEIERVEILRGPQGTLFGRNTIGGAVNVVSVKPGDEFSAAIQFTTGSYNRFDAKGSVNVPLVPGKLAARVAVATRNRDGYGKRLDFFTGEKTGEMGDQDSLSGRALLNWTPTDDVDVLLSFDAKRVRQTAGVYKIVAFLPSRLVGLLNTFVDPDYGNVFVTDSEYTSYATGPNINNFDAWGTSLTVEWDLGNAAVKSITGYRDLKTEASFDGDGSPYTILHYPSYIINQKQFSQEFQFSGLSLDDRLSWLGGLFYYEEKGGQDPVQLDIMLELKDLIGLDISFSAPMWFNVKSYAAFTQETYELTDKLNITGGLRYTYEEKEITRTRFGQYSGIVTVPLSSRSDNWDAVSGRLGFEYSWNEDAMTYLSVSRGFRSGGINARSASELDFLPYDPEYLTSYEVGLKSDWLDDRLRFNTSVYFSDYKDLQFTVSFPDPVTGVPISTVGNQAKAEIKGFEMDVVAMPAAGLTFTAGIGYTDAKYIEVDPTSRVGVDDKFPNIPKWSVTLSGTYSVPINAWGGELRARLDYVRKSKIYYQANNDPFNTQDAYGLLNARLSFESTGSNWAVSLFGTNLTDERYLLGGVTIRAFGFSRAQFARPREWGVELNYRF